MKMIDSAFDFYSGSKPSFIAFSLFYRTVFHFSWHIFTYIHEHFHRVVLPGNSPAPELNFRGDGRKPILK